MLRNRLGIVDQQRLREVEAGLTLAALADLGTRILPGGYDLNHLRAFHSAIFGDLYPWAGEIRVVTIARSDPFCLPQHIEAYSAEVFGHLGNRCTCDGCLWHMGPCTVVDLSLLEVEHSRGNGVSVRRTGKDGQRVTGAGGPLRWRRYLREIQTYPTSHGLLARCANCHRVISNKERERAVAARVAADYKSAS